MLDDNDVAQRPRGGVEIKSSVVRRRRWSDEEKGRIVAEALSPGAVIARVAHRHDLTPQHLSNWIKSAKAGRLVLPGEDGMAFVPVIAGEGSLAGEPAAGLRERMIEIVVGGMTVRAFSNVDPRRLEDILRAARRSLA